MINLSFHAGFSAGFCAGCFSSISRDLVGTFGQILTTGVSIYDASSSGEPRSHHGEMYPESLTGTMMPSSGRYGGETRHRAEARCRWPSPCRPKQRRGVGQLAAIIAILSHE